MSRPSGPPAFALQRHASSGFAMAALSPGNKCSSSFGVAAFAVGWIVCMVILAARYTDLIFVSPESGLQSGPDFASSERTLGESCWNFSGRANKLRSGSGSMKIVPPRNANPLASPFDCRSLRQQANHPARKPTLNKPPPQTTKARTSRSVIGAQKLPKKSEV